MLGRSVLDGQRSPVGVRGRDATGWLVGFQLHPVLPESSQTTVQFERYSAHSILLQRSEAKSGRSEPDTCTRILQARAPVTVLGASLTETKED
jgi:hypothetical protein